MRTPPSLNTLFQYPVTAGVGILAVVVTLCWWQKSDISYLFMDDRAWQGELWRPISSMLPHIDFLHLAFNLFWLWVFGTLVEQVFGPLRTAGIILLFAAGSSLAESAVAAGGVGLSGVGYGLFGLLWVLSRKDPRFRDAIDHQTIALFIFWFFLCIILTAAGVWRIGNVAHGMGALLGALLGWGILTHGRTRFLPWSVLALTLIVTLWGATVGRRYVNLTGAAGGELAGLAYRDLEAQHWEKAASRLRRAVEMDDRQADWWINLGIGYLHLGRHKEADEAFQRALDLKPQSAESRASLAVYKAQLAYEKEKAGNHEAAVRLYREGLDLDGRKGELWYNLGWSLQKLGEDRKALEAFEKASKLEPANASFRKAAEQLRRQVGSSEESR